jgi:hypothetical protein
MRVPHQVVRKMEVDTEYIQLQPFDQAYQLFFGTD